MDHLWQALFTPGELAQIWQRNAVPWNFPTQSGVHVIGLGGCISKVCFSHMIRALPNVYKQVREARDQLMWLVPPYHLQDYRDQLASRTHVGVDICFVPGQEPPLACYGIRILEAPIAPVILTFQDNWPKVAQPEAMVIGLFLESVSE